LEEHGIEKVIPDAPVLESAYRRAVLAKLARKRVAKAVREAEAEAERAPVPSDLDVRVREAQREDPSLSWSRAVRALAGDEVEEPDADEGGNPDME